MGPKLLIAVALVACTCGVIWYAGPGRRTPQERADALQEKALALIRRGDHAAAIECLEKRVRLPEGRDAVTYSRLGACYQYEGQYRKALRRYEKALSLEPRRAPARVAYAGCLLKAIGDKQEAWRRADAELAKLTAKDRQHPVVTYNLACLFAENGRWQQALRYLAYSIRVEPGLKGEARIDPSFDSIRDSQEFQRLVR